MLGIEKRYENHGGELREVVIYDKKGLFAGAAFLAAIATVGILAAAGLNGFRENGGVFGWNLTKEIERIAQGYSEASGDPSNGATKQKVTYYSKVEEDGLIMRDTMTFSAWNDTIFLIEETVEIDIGILEEDTKEAVREVYDALVKQYQSIEGVACFKKNREDVYTIEIAIDISPEVVEELTSRGLLEIEGEGGRYSLKESEESLERQGYQKISK